jgi:hypothetical protein
MKYNKEELVELLRDDKNYYGDIGNKILSNSNIDVLLKNPIDLKKATTQTVPMLVGGYFHTAILEPDKLKKYRVIPSSTRGTKIYKELSEGALCMLQHEVDQLELLADKLLDNKIVNDMIYKGNVVHEEPGIAELEGNLWKGKADIINHDEKLVVDIKTTSSIDLFKSKARRYNYDSQAYIYSKIFGYEVLFIVIDKTTGRIGLFDCSPDFYQRGYDKFMKATDAYELFYKTDGFDASQYFITNTL